MARKSRKNIPPNNNLIPVNVLAYQAWIYARISNENDKAEDSIDNQTAICREYIHSKNELIHGGTFIDIGYSGTDFDRPGYTDMIAGILKGDVKCIVVKDLSRLGRTYIEVGELLFDTFVQQGIRFISVNDNYDSFADDAGRKKLMILFKNLINHMYSKDISKKIRSAHCAKKQRGELAGRPPYGYMRGKDGITLVPDSEAAEIVKRIFDLRLSGESANKIAQLLTREGVPSPQNRQYQLGYAKHEKYSERIVWTVSYISRMLKNEIYTGMIINGKFECEGKNKKLLPKELWNRHENMHQAIIGKEQFDLVQTLISKDTCRSKKKTGERKYVNKYAGKIFCSRCGRIATQLCGNTRYKLRQYYRCRRCDYDLKAELGLQKTPRLSLEKLDSIIMTILRQHMNVLVQYDELEQELYKNQRVQEKKIQLQKDVCNVKKATADYDNILKKAYTHFLEGLLDQREYETIRLKTECDKAQSETLLIKLRAEESRYMVNNILENRWLVKYREFRNCEAPTKEMIQALVGKIVLTPLTNELFIELNYCDELAELQQIIHGNGGRPNE